MYRDKPGGLFVKYALPQMAGLLLNSVYLIVDGMFIGNRLGRDAMAAAAVAVPAVEIIIAVALAVSIGTGVIVSAAFGAGDGKKANETFNLSLAVAGIAAVVIALSGILFLPQIATALGATPEIHADAMVYLRYILVGSPFLVFSFVLSTFARADGEPNLAMWALAIGSASNIALDYLFMYPLNMGIAGAALATALGPIFSVAILLPHFLRGRGRLRFARVRLSGGMAWRILRLGAPAFVMEFSIGIVTLIYNVAITRNGFGELGLAAYLTMGYMALLILTVFLGIAQGIQPVVSYFHGRGETARARELMLYLFKAQAVLWVGISLGVLLFARRFIQIFTPGDTELIDFTFDKSLVYFSGFIFAGMSILVITYFQSVERPGPAFVLALLRSAVLVPILVFAAPAVWGAEAIWPALSVAELAAFGIGMHMYRRERPTGKTARTERRENGGTNVSGRIFRQEKA